MHICFFLFLLFSIIILFKMAIKNSVEIFALCVIFLCFNHVNNWDTRQGSPGLDLLPFLILSLWQQEVCDGVLWICEQWYVYHPHKRWSQSEQVVLQLQCINTQFAGTLHILKIDNTVNFNCNNSFSVHATVANDSICRYIIMWLMNITCGQS